MTRVTAAKVNYGVWGLIGGAIIAMIIGFGWGGWTTTRTNRTAGRRGGLAARLRLPASRNSCNNRTHKRNSKN